MTWPRVPIASIKADTPHALVGGPFGSELTTRDYVPEGVPVIRGQNLPAGQVFNEDEFVYVSPEKADLLRANTATRGDLIFTQRGTLGQVGLIPATSRFDRYVVSQSQMKLTVAQSRADARFVYHYFSLPHVVEEIKARAITSGVPHINLGTLKEFEIPLPPVLTQSRIAAIASTYDDLISNNQGRIRLLDEAARRLYREWFVALRFPGHELGKVVGGVPQGWERGTVGDALQLQRGFDLPSAERKVGGVPIVTSTGIAGYHNESRVQGPGVVTGRSGTLGVVHFVHEDFWPLNTSLWVKEFRRVTPLCAYFLLSELGLAQFNSGASVPTLDRNVVHPLPVLIPPGSVQREFDRVANPLFEQRHALEKAANAARQARDAILPRLMSGALAV